MRCSRLVCCWWTMTEDAADAAMRDDLVRAIEDVRRWLTWLLPESWSDCAWDVLTELQDARFRFVAAWYEMGCRGRRP